MLFIVAVLIIAAISLFYGLQKYIVVVDDEVKLVLPFMNSPSPDVETTPGDYSNEDMELVITTPNFEEVQTQAGAGLESVNAVFVPASQVNAQGLDTYAANLEAKGAGALVLEMKPSSGQLSWVSGVHEATSFAVNGSEDIRDAITKLKDKDIYLVAQISACVDELMATRNLPLALKNTENGVYSDSTGYWLDPYNRTVRQYVIALMKELADMGFDEILLTNIAHPVDAEKVVYSQDMSTAPDVSTAVSNFALAMSSAMDDSEVKVSAVFDRTSLPGQEQTSGQDLDFFYVVFDRVYLYTSEDTLAADEELAKNAMTEGTLASRFVPIVTTAPETGSWVLK